MSIQEKYIAFLLEEESYPFPVDGIVHFETHISHVFLAGEFAFKMKKAIQLPFLDFRDGKARKYFIEEELRLNSRYAEPLYLSVEAVSLEGDKVQWGESGDQPEYLVKMRRFEKGALFSELLASGNLTESLVAELIDCVAAFHREAEPEPDTFSIETVRKLIFDCIDIVGEFSSQELMQIESMLNECAPLIEKRRKTHVKFLHGDLHLRNICVFQGHPYPFDGIEFDKQYACSDTWADLAFLLMDLLYRGEEKLSWVAINRYLEQTADYEGVGLLPLFILYRALVRAKIACLRYEQLREESDLTSVAEHLKLARRMLQPRKPRVFVVGGFSGSGKTFVARLLAKEHGLFHLRTDVFRKVLAGVPLDEHLSEREYRETFSKKVYAAVYAEARALLSKGFGVVIDGVHGKEWSNLLVSQLLKEYPDGKCLWCRAPDSVVRNRLKHRTGDASDADIVVYEQQKRIMVNPTAPWEVLNTDAPDGELLCSLTPL